MSKTSARVAAALLAFVPSLLGAQQTPASSTPPSIARLTARIDSVVQADLLSRGVPSVSVVVVRGNETLVQKAWGKADIASGRSAEPSTLYSLGSVTKQFTAVLVLKLVERGRLKPGDPIRQHLSGLPAEWLGITIEQLLNHTSGLPRGGYVNMSRIEEEVSFDTILARAARLELTAKPGKTHSYSNTGYVVLGALVEKMYGKPYGIVLRDEIARPLGLTTLGYCGDADAKMLATGYMLSPEDGKLSSAPDLHPSQQLGAGGICSTAADLAKWNRALHGGRVLSAATYEAMITPRGAAEDYGFGISVGKVRWGDAIIAHGGQEPSGYVAENAWYPEQSLSVTILYNVFPRVADARGTHPIAAVVLGETLPAPPRAAPHAVAAAAPTGSPATGIVGAEARRKFVGEYEVRPGARPFRVAFENGGFVMMSPTGGKLPLVHKSGATYALGSADATTLVTFLADEEGRVIGFLAREGNGSERRLRKVR